MRLSEDVLKKLIRQVANTRPDEASCDDCFHQLDQFAELVLAGRPAAEAMPLLQDHLARCGDCREEFQALLAVLRAMDQ